MTAQDNYIAHLTARAQRLLAMRDRAECEGDTEALRDAQEALRRVEAAMETMAREDDEIR